MKDLGLQKLAFYWTDTPDEACYDADHASIPPSSTRHNCSAARLQHSRPDRVRQEAVFAALRTHRDSTESLNGVIRAQAICSRMRNFRRCPDNRERIDRWVSHLPQP